MFVIVREGSNMGGDISLSRYWFFWCGIFVFVEGVLFSDFIVLVEVGFRFIIIRYIFLDREYWF